MPRSPSRARRRGRRYIGFGSWLSVARKPSYLLGRRLRVDDMATILFVCVENTFRSVLSEALFDASAPPGWQAESAGVQAATAINPAVIELLQEIGFRLVPKTPRTVTPDMIAPASRVVTVECLYRGPAARMARGEDWP